MGLINESTFCYFSICCVMIAVVSFAFYSILLQLYPDVNGLVMYRIGQTKDILERSGHKNGTFFSTIYRGLNVYKTCKMRFKSA